MVEANGGGGGFVIRKQTMIVKNERSIDDVYQRESKVSQSLIYFTRVCAFSNLARVLMVRSVEQLTEKLVKEELSRLLHAQKSRTGIVSKPRSRFCKLLIILM